jgi:hypothetical protein
MGYNADAMQRSGQDLLRFLRNTWGLDKTLAAN